MPQNQSRFQFSKDYVVKKYLDHWGLAEDFCTHFLEAFGVKSGMAEIDPRRLKLAVESAYQDIARYKDFHQKDPATELLDCTKRCAFLLKWIIKFKPIEIRNVDFENETLDYVELVNETFALYLFDVHLSDELKFDVGIAQSKIHQFAYDLLYRQISTDGWIAIFQLLKDTCFPQNVSEHVPFMEVFPLTK